MEKKRGRVAVAKMVRVVVPAIQCQVGVRGKSVVCAWPVAASAGGKVSCLLSFGFSSNLMLHESMMIIFLLLRCYCTLSCFNQ